MSIPPHLIQRIVTLNLSAENFAEVIAVLSEVASQNVTEPSPPSPGALRQRRWRQRLGTSPNVSQSSPSVSNRLKSVSSDYIDNNLSSLSTYTNSKELKDICDYPSPGDAPKTRRRITYSPLFETSFWRAYPKDANMSKSEAFDVFKRLSPEDQQKAVDGIPGFVAYCKQNPTYRVIHACRYLSRRRFDAYAEGSMNGHTNGTVFDEHNPPPGVKPEDWAIYQQHKG